MAVVLKPGTAITSPKTWTIYTIESEVSLGRLARSYLARTAKGEAVFLKQFKSPSVRVDWYQAYVAWQEDIKRCIQGGGARDFVYEILDYFEYTYRSHPRTYCQAFRFLSTGQDLRAYMDSSAFAVVPWEDRVALATKLAEGLAALHAAQVVHADLKPENVFLLPGSSATRPHPKFIDFDGALVAGKPAPWAGTSGYIGSDRYFSPEHIRGEVPLAASDVFSLALVLHEVLDGGHPYPMTRDAYAAAARARTAAKPMLLASTWERGPTSELAALLHRCLAPDPKDRPTAPQLHADLMRLARSPMSREALDPAFSAGRRLVFSAGSGRQLSFGVATAVGRRLTETLDDPDNQYVSAVQFLVEPTERGWRASRPEEPPKNQTLVNGQPLNDPRLLRQGDVISVGNAARNVIKLPLTISYA